MQNINGKDNIELQKINSVSQEKVQKSPEELKREEELNKLLLFQVKPVSITKLYYTLSSNFDVFLMILATIGSLASGVGMPMFSLLFGNTISGFGPRSGNPEDTIGTMVRNFLAVGAGVFLAQFLNVGLWILVGKRQSHRMKEMYFSLIMKQEQGWFDSNNAYEFSTKVQAQLKQVEGGLGEKFGMAIMGMGQFVAGIVVSFTVSWKLSLVMMGCIPFIGLSAIAMMKSVRGGLTEARKAYEKAGGIAEEVLYNIKTVASFCNFEFEKKRYAEYISKCEYQGIDNSKKLGIGMGFTFFFVFFTYCIAIIYGSRLVVQKEYNENYHRVFLAGDVITVLFTCVMAASSLGQVAPNLKSVAEACVAASDFFQLRDRIPLIDVSNSNDKPEKDKLNGHIKFENVSFAYPSKPSDKILKNINLTFEPGKKIAIVGKSGSGKSTIVNLIERLYECKEGSITFDGIDLKNFDIKYLRNLIGYVQQEPVLFNRSIKDNIIFGREQLFPNQAEMDKMIIEACKDSYAAEFIEEIDGKYDYIVGIKGSKLSGGQKQRIAIARAILAKPKILLLDEATSALDNKSEKEVQRALDEICKKNVTTIIIAHRLSTVKNADKIIAINNGEVEEEGTHEELLKKDGYYAALIRSQLVLEEFEKQENVIQKKNLQLESVRSNTNPHVNFEEVEKLYGKNKEDEQIKPLQIERGRLFSLLTNQKCNIAVASIGSAANGCVFPIYGYVLASALNVLSSPDDSVVLNDGLFIGIMFIVIAFCAGLATFLQNWKFGHIGEVLTSKLRVLVFEKYLQLHLGFFDIPSNSPGSLLTKLSLDTTLLNGIVLTVVGGIVQTLIGITLGLTLGFVSEWRLSLIALSFFPFMAIGGYYTQKIRKGISSGDDKVDIEAGGILSECVINTKTIYSYNFESKAVDMYLEILCEIKNGFCRESIFAGFFFGLSQFTNFAAFATLFYAGGKFMVNDGLPFDRLTRSIMTILFAAFGAGMAQQHAGDYGKASNAFNSLFSIVNSHSLIDTKIEENQNKISAENVKGKIEFRNVNFAYPSRPTTSILKNISFTILPGQSVAFVGPSGNGKSTIIQLIERFYDVTEGVILIDDVDIKDYNLLELRRKVGLVMQEPCLFKRDVKENIRYGNLNATDDEIFQAAEKANIQKFFTKDDQGTKDTPVSGGEKQRIAIARTFLKNPTIMLLDEATSALDKESEVEVQKSLDKLLEGKTSITIAHRLSTIEKSDVIYVLDHGCIVEQGNHQELYEKRGGYYTLHKYSSQ